MVRCMLGFLFATITVALYFVNPIAILADDDDGTTSGTTTWRRLANSSRTSTKDEEGGSDITLVIGIVAVAIIGSLACASRKQTPLQTRVEIASRMGGQYNYGQRLKEGGGEREPRCNVCGETYPRTSMHCTSCGAPRGAPAPDPAQARGRVRVGEEGYHSASLGPLPSPHGSVTSFPRMPILFLAGCAIAHVNASDELHLFPLFAFFGTLPPSPTDTPLLPPGHAPILALNMILLWPVSIA